jgi:flagellar biosynthesis protein FlhB
MAPFFAVAAVAAVVSNSIQSGPTLTGFPIKPDLQRINPVSGFKRLFSLRILFETAKTIVKFAALSFVGYLAIEALLPSLFAIQQADPKGYLPLLFDNARSVLFILLLVLCAIGLLDLAYNRWDFGKRMMMSRREIRDEVKRREGDPAVRAKLRELQREAVKRAKSLKRVPEADVLITNPNHYAIALRYDRRSMQAPNVLAKGAGELAQSMKRVARAGGVPIVENKNLAKGLFAGSEIDQPVASEFFEPLARVYADVYGRRDARLALEIRQ